MDDTSTKNTAWSVLPRRDCPYEHLGNTLYIVRSTKQQWADLLCEDVQVDIKTHSTSGGTDN